MVDGPARAGDACGLAVARAGVLVVRGDDRAVLGEGSARAGDAAAGTDAKVCGGGGGGGGAAAGEEDDATLEARGRDEPGGGDRLTPGLRGLKICEGESAS